MTNKFQFKYQISFEKIRPNHILFQVEIPTYGKDVLELNLPVWRPGRYELANYAQYIKDFKAVGKGNKMLNYEKPEASYWHIHCSKEEKVIITYSFYSNRIDAGFSFADEQQIYLNPVNCFLFVNNEQCEYEIEFKVKKGSKVFSPLKKLSTLKLKSNSYDELFDSPTIVSKTALVSTFKVGKYSITNVFQGVCKPNFKQIENDFKKFIKLQIDSFGELPVKEFTFLNQITSHRFFHGVEHKKNTVLAFGPGYLLNEKEGYKNFLGLACHEFYHIWNVKHIRPKNLFPYDFTKPNYHHIGYVIEGVTTYQGEHKLWQSKVIDDNSYLKSLGNQVNRHLNNEGRYNQSVRESSIDLWLDGYLSGIPGKKVSIYTEGALISLIIDIKLLESSNGKYALDDVMKLLYQNYAKNNEAYNEVDYINTILSLGGRFAKKLYKDLVNSAISYEKELTACLLKVGIEISKKSISLSTSNLGIKVNNEEQPGIVQVLKGSPAEEAGFVENMNIISVNGMAISNNLDNWMSYFRGEDLEFLVSLKGDIRSIRCKLSNKSFCNKIELIKVDRPNASQKHLFSKWRKY